MLNYNKPIFFMYAKLDSRASLARGLFDAAAFQASTAIFLNLALSDTGQSIIVKSPAALSLAT